MKLLIFFFAILLASCDSEKTSNIGKDDVSASAYDQLLLQNETKEKELSQSYENSAPGSFTEIEQASCGNARLLFQCSLENNKELKLCESRGLLNYTFGRPNVPELAFSSRRDHAAINRWDGVGFYEIYSIGVMNGSYKYEVFYEIKRSNFDFSGGVHVYNGTKYLSSLFCKPQSIVSDLVNL